MRFEKPLMPPVRAGTRRERPVGGLRASSPCVACTAASLRILGPMEAERSYTVAADGLVEGDEDRGGAGTGPAGDSARSGRPGGDEFMGDGSGGVVPSSALISGIYRDGVTVEDFSVVRRP